MKKFILIITLILTTLSITASENSEKLTKFILKKFALIIKGDLSNLNTVDADSKELMFNKELQDIYKDCLSYNYYIQSKNSKLIKGFFAKIQNLCKQITKDLSKVDKKKIASENRLSAEQAEKLFDFIDWLRISTKYMALMPQQFIDLAINSICR